MTHCKIIKLIETDRANVNPKETWYEGESYRRCNNCGRKYYYYLLGGENKLRQFEGFVCPDCGKTMGTEIGNEFLFINSGYSLRCFLMDWYNKQNYPNKIDTTQKGYTAKPDNRALIIEALRSLNGWDDSYEKYLVDSHYTLGGKRTSWVKDIIEKKGSDYPPKPEKYVDDNIFAFLRFLRRNFTNSKQELVKQLTDKIEMSCTPSTIQSSLGRAKELSTSQIKDYLEKLINVETSIYSVTKRLEVVYFDEEESVQEYKENFAATIKQKQAERDKREKEYMELESEGAPVVRVADLIPPITRKDMTSQYPPEPIKPDEPVMEEPGLFNKKKVEKANQIKKEAYEKAYQEWEEKRKERLAIVFALNKQAEEEYYRERGALLKEYTPLAEREKEKKTVEYKQKLAGAKAALDRAKEGLNQLQNDIENVKQPLTEEKMQAEKMLHDLIEAKYKLLSTNIIFPKYRNIVAYTTMYEYFLTGRCEAFEGPAGAYNLYESETRANMIISQLATVISSLEKIKDNQYLLYNEIQNVNNSLDSLNRTTMGMFTTMNDMKGDIATMAKNSNVIAYNTAKTAYYSEMNAKLTDALGYMVALS